MFLTILEGMIFATIKKISFSNSSETGSIYLSVDDRPLSNQIKTEILGLCEW